VKALIGHGPGQTARLIWAFQPHALLGWFVHRCRRMSHTHSRSRFALLFNQCNHAAPRVVAQIEEYWQLYNDKNDPTTAGILKWAKRPPDQFYYHTITRETSSG
jgi:hypothetical protein